MATRDAVTDQYERYAYPDPAVGVAHRIVWNDPGVYHWLYWPDRAPWAHRELLVAGCGTSEAVALALRDPQSRVVGIDISEAALAHQQALADTHGVANLTLRHLPIERVGELGRTFDFISVAGVLHHLADPAAGLKALGAVLRPHGVIVGAVYGTHARLGVHLVQQALRELGAGRDADGVQLARAALEGLSPQHPARAWVAATAPIWGPDAHIVDAWLPAREATYDVPGVLDLVARAGLTFQGWFNNQPYHPDGLWAPEHPAHAALAAQPAEAVWRTMARLSTPSDHCFMVCRPDRPHAQYALDLDGPALDALVPGPRFPPAPQHPPVPYDPRHAVQTALYRRIDGHTPVGALGSDLGLPVEPPWLADYTRAFVRHLWRKDAVYLRHAIAPA